MIALLYLAVVVFLGDALASRWFRPVTWFHRLADGLPRRPAHRDVDLVPARRCCSTAATEDALLVGDLASGWAMALAAIAIYRWVAAPPGRRPPATPDP